MPRTPITPGQPLTEVLKVRLKEGGGAAIDQVRGTLSRSEWARRQIEKSLPKDFRPVKVTTGTLARVAGEHRHKPGKLLAERTVKGVTTKTYRCAHTGCNAEMERTR